MSVPTLKSKTSYWSLSLFKSVASAFDRYVGVNFNTISRVNFCSFVGEVVNPKVRGFCEPCGKNAKKREKYHKRSRK